MECEACHQQWTPSQECYPGAWNVIESLVEAYESTPPWSWSCGLGPVVRVYKGFEKRVLRSFAESYGLFPKGDHPGGGA